jgi:hypothetical protein
LLTNGPCETYRFPSASNTGPSQYIWTRAISTSGLFSPKIVSERKRLAITVRGFILPP